MLLDQALRVKRVSVDQQALVEKVKRGKKENEVQLDLLVLKVHLVQREILVLLERMD